MEISAEETNDLLSYWYETNLEEESRQYFISTCKGMRGAMCTETFLSEDNGDTRTVTLKDVLDAEYKVRLIIDNPKLKTGLKIRV